MKDEQLFMMIFRFNPTADFKPTKEQQAEMHQHWGSFIGNMAISEKLVSTHQLGSEGKQIHADLSVKEGILFSDGFTLGGNMIVKANSLDEAVELAKESPILKMGGTVEVRNINPM